MAKAIAIESLIFALFVICSAGTGFELSYKDVTKTLGEASERVSDFAETNPTVTFEGGIVTLKNDKGNIGGANITQAANVLKDVAEYGVNRTTELLVNQTNLTSNQKLSDITPNEEVKKEEKGISGYVSARPKTS